MKSHEKLNEKKDYLDPKKYSRSFYHPKVRVFFFQNLEFHDNYTKKDWYTELITNNMGSIHGEAGLQ